MHGTINIKFMSFVFFILTLILPKWRIGWAPNNASKWQMEINAAFKGLKACCLLYSPKVHRCGQNNSLVQVSESCIGPLNTTQTLTQKPHWFNDGKSLIEKCGIEMTYLLWSFKLIRRYSLIRKYNLSISYVLRALSKTSQLISAGELHVSLACIIDNVHFPGQHCRRRAEGGTGEWIKTSRHGRPDQETPCSYHKRITLLQVGQWPIPWASALRFTFQNKQLSTPHRNKSSS